MKRFKAFLMQGDLVVIAVGLVIALGFSTLIKAFTDNIITPLVNAVGGSGLAGKGLGWTINGQRIGVGAFVSSIIYFVIFVAVIYFLLVVPYRYSMKRSVASTSSVTLLPPRPARSVWRPPCRWAQSSAGSAGVSSRPIPEVPRSTNRQSVTGPGGSSPKARSAPSRRQPAEPAAPERAPTPLLHARGGTPIVEAWVMSSEYGGARSTPSGLSR